jgi:hypothetical protein
MRHGCGCDSCNKKTFQPHNLKAAEQVRDEILDATDGTTQLQVNAYTRSQEKCDFVCLICGNTWCAVPSVLLWESKNRRTTGCSKCSRRLQAQRQQRTIEDVRVYVADCAPEITVLAYDPIKHRVDMKCDKCAYEFTTGFDSDKEKGKTRFRCPRCTPCESSGERFVRRVLDYNQIEYQQEYSYFNTIEKTWQRFDFLLPVQKLVIEINGDQHTNESNSFYKTRMVYLDKVKRQWALDQGLHVLDIDYPTESMISQLVGELGLLAVPPFDYKDSRESEYQDVIAYLTSGHNLIETQAKFNMGPKVVNRYIKMRGYANYWDLYHTERMKRLGLTNDLIIDWLKHNHFSHIEEEIGITKKYVINHILNNPDYPYTNLTDIKDEAIRSDEFTKYRKTHSKRATSKYFMTDAAHIIKLIGAEKWDRKVEVS